MEAVMETVRSFKTGVRRKLAMTVLAGAAVAAFAIPTQGAAQRGESEGTPASGTVGVTSRQIVLSYRDGRDMVQERLVHRQLTGTFAGAEVAVVHYVTHQDGSATITGAETCTCMVEGRTGTVTFIDKGTVSAAGNISVRRTSIDATGGLAGIRAELDISGPIAAPTQNYNGHYTFDDED
jgi:hypothetical protein